MSVVEQLSPSQRARALHHRLMHPANAVPDTPIDLKRASPEFVPVARRALVEQAPFDPLDFIFGPKVYAGDPLQLPTLGEILDTVCKFYRARKIDVLSNRRTADLVKPRQVVCYLAYQLTLVSYTQMGRFLRRDHTSCLHGKRQIAERIAEDEMLASEIKHLQNKIVGESFVLPKERVVRS
jgi:hypothetical protein